jgi:tRNA (guanine37-N1)-methyltransferase
MSRIEVLTLFPGIVAPFLAEGLLGRASAEGLVELEPVDLRGFGLGRHRQVDDVPYGGGAGMVLRPEPLFAAVRARQAANAERGMGLHRVLLTPQGRPFDQRLAEALLERISAGRQTLLLLCGRYEGFDERIRLGACDEEISGGDFVCLGGEAIALAIVEAVVRLIPGVLGNPRSADEESFAGGQLEYPQYTRPPEFEGMAVPEVLLSGNHAEIARWRREQALRRTRSRRPDLLMAKAARANGAG